MIRRRGENVAPAEIEEALADHPDVLEAAVVGVPSELSEEEIKAFLLVADPAEADLAAIREHAAGEPGAVQGAALPRGGRRAAAHADRAVAKHQLQRERNDPEVDFDAARAGGR